ncbi:hypothetical protein ACI2L4_09815 [Streptomyces sparsogenes]|uniref:hypothetical protein n=1 Tax=Streptomyces sparsogenes TaxID=67365 RepID=UPI003851309C
MPTTSMVGVHQQVRELRERSPGAGDVAGDGRCDPVTVLGCSLAVLTEFEGTALLAQFRVAAYGVPAGKVPVHDEVSRSLREPVQPHVRWANGCDCL